MDLKWRHFRKLLSVSSWEISVITNCNRSRWSRLMENELQHFITPFLFPPQSSRSPTKPTCFMPWAPPPTTTLCCASAGGPTGDISAPLLVLELNPRAATPSEKHLSWLNVWSTSRRQRSCSSATAAQQHVCGRLYVLTVQHMWAALP